ncbi:hypothetical protein NDU88_004551 [Pleurodeles waltl]|uniref:Uncharacterized protein n=1 Tax=Pleurodeles waltl TaxID=8319 RepID=A0AAV7W6Z5_PLEWA|nr:hypothetical protein NDU88_004551 [Pleurodeles waltl]
MFFRVRRNSRAARCHQTARAVLQATSDAIKRGAHIRVLCDRCSSARLLQLPQPVPPPESRNGKRSSALRDLRSRHQLSLAPFTAARCRQVCGDRAGRVHGSASEDAVILWWIPDHMMICYTQRDPAEKHRAQRLRSHFPYSEEGSYFPQDVSVRDSGGVLAVSSVSLTVLEVYSMIDGTVTKALTSKSKAKRPSALLEDDEDSGYSDISEPEIHVVHGGKLISREELVDIRFLRSWRRPRRRVPML